jgi:hypothetical protein
MAKIAARALTLNAQTDSFSANGVTTAFTLTQSPYSSSFLTVFLDGLFQNPSNYSLSGTTLTFTAAPPTGADILAWYMRSN